jgi:hypothetical protein
MCIDTPGETPRKRIAVCSCGASFPDCDLKDAKEHNPNSLPNHRWIWVDSEIDWRNNVYR